MNFLKENIMKKSFTVAKKYLYSLGYDCAKINSKNHSARFCGFNGNDITLICNDKAKVKEIIFENEKTILTDWL